MKHYKVEVVTRDILFKKSSNSSAKGYKESLNDFFDNHPNITI